MRSPPLALYQCASAIVPGIDCDSKRSKANKRQAERSSKAIYHFESFVSYQKHTINLLIKFEYIQQSITNSFSSQTTSIAIMCRSFILPKQPSTMISSPTTAIVGNSSSPDNSSSSSDATTTNTKSLTQHISLLHGIMRSQRWPAFENIVLSNPAVFDMLSNAIPTHEEFNSGTTLLHACLRYKHS